MRDYSDVGVAILAAGSSSRLGRPKQLVELEEKTLLQHTIDQLSKVPLRTKWLILGANALEIVPLTNLGDFIPIVNEHWQEGIASSIRAATQEATSNPEINHLLVLVSDQPFLSTELIENLLLKHSKDREITASAYADQVGVPAIFSRKYFGDLLELEGDKGAKRIIQKHLSKTALISFRNGEIDIDTEEDIDKLKQQENESYG